MSNIETVNYLDLDAERELFELTQCDEDLKCVKFSATCTYGEYKKFGHYKLNVRSFGGGVVENHIASDMTRSWQIWCVRAEVGQIAKNKEVESLQRQIAQLKEQLVNYIIG